VLAKVPGAILGAVVVLGVAATALPLSPLAGLTLLAWPAALLLALRMPVLGSAVMVWLGDRSYAIYLINMPLVWAATALFGPLQGGTMLVLGAHLALVAVTLLLADLSLRLVENPARRAIRGWWQQRKAAQQLAITPALP
jgi:peptidoglycan/LPS O-acetylase OafA/YrhL